MSAPTKVLDVANHGIAWMTLRPDNVLVLCGHTKVYHWDLTEGVKVSELTLCHPDYGYCTYIVEGGNTVLEVNEVDAASFIIRHDLKTRTKTSAYKPTACFSGVYIPGGATSFADLNDGSFLTGDAHGTIRRWNVKTGEQLYLCEEEHPGWVESIVLLGEEISSGSTAGAARTFLSGCDGGTICQWDLETGKLLRKLSVREDSAECIGSLSALNDDGSFFSGHASGDIYKIDLTTKTIVDKFKGHTSRISGLHLLPDRISLLSSSWDKTIRQWNIATGDTVKIFNCHSPVAFLTLLPDGTFLSAHRDTGGKIYQWSLP
jgi:WD40 repeat protein